jgi:hypothetical protein
VLRNKVDEIFLGVQSRSRGPIFQILAWILHDFLTWRRLDAGGLRDFSYPSSSERETIMQSLFTMRLKMTHLMA